MGRHRIPDASGSRRDFLRAAGTALASAPFVASSGCAADDPLPRGLVVSATDDLAGGHHVTGFAIGEGATFELEVPSRCHAAALRPQSFEVAVVSRRPGTAIYIVDVRLGTRVRTISAEPGRHFFGHAVFDREGRRLFATENVFDDAAVPDLTPRDAVIGVYDAAAEYARVAELPAHGVGAHEIGMLADQTLVVAVGGIYTHPSRPREDLGVATMDPSLAYVDAATGALLAQHRPGDPKLSIRHLAVGPDDDVAVGFQYHGDAGARVPLVAWQPGRQHPLSALEAPGDAWDALEHYIASVAIHPGAGTLAASSPVGGRVAFWSLTADEYVGSITAADVSGVGVAGDDYIATAGTGSVYVIDAREPRVRRELRAVGVRWDNHLTIGS